MQIKHDSITLVRPLGLCQQTNWPKVFELIIVLQSENKHLNKRLKSLVASKCFQGRKEKRKLEIKMIMEYGYYSRYICRHWC